MGCSPTGSLGGETEKRSCCKYSPKYLFNNLLHPYMAFLLECWDGVCIFNLRPTKTILQSDLVNPPPKVVIQSQSVKKKEFECVFSWSKSNAFIFEDQTLCQGSHLVHLSQLSKSEKCQGMPPPALWYSLELGVPPSDIYCQI